MKNNFGIAVFKGNKQEYEDFVGHSCKIVGPNAQLYPSAIYLDEKFLNEEGAKNIEALVNAQILGDSQYNGIFGLPVKKKE